MRSVRRSPSLLLLLVLTTVSCASAKLAGRDVVAVAKAPVKEWKQVAAATAVVGATVLLDDEIAGIARKNGGPLLDSVTEAIEPFGGGHSDKVIAGFLLYGLAARNEKARHVAFDAFVASTIAAKGITPMIKQLTNRRRPNGGDDPSFPSGHATQAFAVASVIAEHYEQRWVRWLAYGVATTVGVSRVYHDDHWASDVIAGAAVGAFVGKTVTETNRTWRITPVHNGVVVSVTW